MNAIEIEGLRVRLGGFCLAVDRLAVPRGAVTGLIGRNGAGKTTLLKAIARQLEAEGGRILYGGEPFAEDEVKHLQAMGIVFDTLHFSPQARPDRLCRLYAAAYPRFDASLYRTLMQRFQLPEDRRIGAYSMGMQRKFCFILALCQRPDVLLLDEPTSGVDPYDRQELTSLIQEFMLDEGHAVLFSTHVTEDLDKVADYVVMLEGGRVAFCEDKVSLTEQYRLVQAAELTPAIRAAAIGITKGAFGYTFLTKDLALAAQNTSKVPTLQELFVHLVGEEKADRDVFGL